VCTSTRPSGPAGTQNGQLVGTDDSRKRCCSPGSSGIMKPCTLTVFWCSACTSAGKLGMSFFFSILGGHLGQQLQDSDAGRSSSGLKALRGSW
jgi:hypothetical protein